MITMKRKSNFQMTMISIENIITCFIIGSILSLQTTSTPIEIAQLARRTVSLNCSKSSSVQIIWRFNENTLLYDGTNIAGDFKDRSYFEIDAATGKEVLTISNIKPGDAGLYKCLNSSNEKVLQSTQLTVLGSEPTCDSNFIDNEFVGPNICRNLLGLSQDEMRFSCAVSYYGTAPHLQWEIVNGSQIYTDSECDILTIEETTKRINCILTLKAEPQYDGSHFRCKVLTAHGEQYNCSTKAIKVLYFIPDEQALKPTHKAVEDKISCSVESSNLELNFSWILEDNNKERHVVGTHRSYVIKDEGLYYCNISYNIKDVSCLTVVSYVQTELGLSLKSLAIVNCLVLVVFAVVSYLCLANKQVKSTLKNMNEKFVTWSKIILLVFAVLDFAVLMFILARHSEKLLNMKYANTVCLLFFVIVEASLLQILQCRYEVSSCIVKLIVIILWSVAVADVAFAIVAAVIVAKNLWGSSDGTTDEWVTSFLLILVFFLCMVLGAFAIAILRDKMKQKEPEAKEVELGEHLSGENRERQ